MNDQNIEELIKATIQTKVIEAFNTVPEAIDKLVESALRKDVDKWGSKPSGYGRDTMPFMEWLVGEEIRKAVQECVNEYIAEHKDSVKEKVRQSIAKADFGKSLSESVADVMSQSYNWRINLNIEKEK